jgi:lipoprotein-releasing system ATP-binding protein
MKNTILRATNLKKTYTSPTTVAVLSNISMEVAKGSSTAIMGKSGEGKSTLLHILGTLEKPCGGSLEICGKPVETKALSSIRNQHIGFIFQAFHLLEDYTTLENILMPSRIAGHNTHPDSPAYKRALELLAAVGLSSRAQFLAKHLSGGEKQRAAIARALCNDPDLILADEPSGNLDHANSIAIYDLLLNLVKKLNKTLIVVTHDQELSSRCDKILVLKDGFLL